MKRVQRMQLVQRATLHAERDRAEALGDAERQVQACQVRLDELTHYRHDYEQSYANPTHAGREISQVRDFQVFLARLSEAISQQRLLLTQACARREAEFAQWRHAAQRAKSVETLADRWQAEDRRADDRREQNESDERAQRTVYRTVSQSAQSGSDDTLAAGESK